MKVKRLLLCVLLLPLSTLAKTDNFTLTLYHTNDTHGRGLTDEGIGYAKIAGYINQQRAIDKNILLLDAGDTFTGIPQADLSYGKANVEVMNLMKYDVISPGNGDFLHGNQRVFELEKLANFPFISANLYYQDKLAFKPYIIKEVNGLRIAIIGASSQNTVVASSVSKMAGLSATNPIDELAKLVPTLKQQADIILLLAHLGKNDPTINVIKLSQTVPDIDIIVDGHDHILLKQGLQEGNTFIVNTGEYNQYIGEVKIQITDRKIAAITARLLDKNDLATIIADRQVAEKIRLIKQENDAYLNQIVATVPFYLEGKREFVRSSQTNLGSIVTDAERELTHADIAITVGAFMRDSLDKGPITLERILSTLPFPLPVVTRKMTGQQIIDFIEHNYNAEKLVTPAFTHVSGLTFNVDFKRPVGNRMTNIRVNGEPIKLNRNYLVASNEQISDFNIRDIPIEETFDITMARLVIDYFNNHSDLKEPSPRVIIK